MSCYDTPPPDDSPYYRWGVAPVEPTVIEGQRIKCAAIIYKSLIYEGLMHHRIGHRMLADTVCTRPFPGGPAQGFTTEAGHFASREVAMLIAVATGQVDPAKCHMPPQLDSSDLIKAALARKEAQ